MKKQEIDKIAEKIWIKDFSDIANSNWISEDTKFMYKNLIIKAIKIGFNKGVKSEKII